MRKVNFSKNSKRKMMNDVAQQNLRSEINRLRQLIKNQPKEGKNPQTPRNTTTN